MKIPQKIEPSRSGGQPEILVAEGLRKSYGSRKVLHELTFSLKAGRILGFLGPNGAGKTTSIRILTTMLEPDAGYFAVDGNRSDDPEPIRRRIGVLPDNPGFPQQMTGLEYLVYFGQLYGLTASLAKEAALSLLENVGLYQRARSLIGSYSHGMRQRLGIVRALINDPLVVFLDEPTSNLDLRGQREILELIQRIARERNKGVVLCSHLISEIEEICDDVIILDQGQVVARGSVSGVIGRVQKNIILRNALRVQVLPESVEDALEILKKIPSIRRVTPIGELEGCLRLDLVPLNNGEDADTYKVNHQILSALIREKIPILGLEVGGGRLRDVFLHLTEDTIR